MISLNLMHEMVIKKKIQNVKKRKFVSNQKLVTVKQHTFSKENTSIKDNMLKSAKTMNLAEVLTNNQLNLKSDSSFDSLSLSDPDDIQDDKKSAKEAEKVWNFTNNKKGASGVKRHPWVVSINDPNRTKWDLFVMIAATFNVFVIPLDLAFEPALF